MQNFDLFIQCWREPTIKHLLQMQYIVLYIQSLQATLKGLCVSHAQRQFARKTKMKKSSFLVCNNIALADRAGGFLIG